VENFGIPSPQVDPAIIREIVAANGQLLGQVGYTAGMGVLNTLAANESQLDLVRDRLRRSVAGLVGQNTRRLTPVRDALAGQLASATSATGALLASTPTGADCPGGLPVDPTFLPPLCDSNAYQQMWYNPTANILWYGPANEDMAAYPGIFAIAGQYVTDPQPWHDDRYPTSTLVTSTKFALCCVGTPLSTGPPPDTTTTTTTTGPPPDTTTTTITTNGPPPEPPPCPQCCCCPCQCAPVKPPPIHRPPPPDTSVSPVEHAQPIYSQDLTLTPLPACALTLGGAPPPVGSAEWCACLDQLAAWFAQLGAQAMDVLFTPTGGGAASGGWLSSVLQSILPGALATVVDPVLSLSVTQTVLDKVRVLFDTIASAASNAGLCNPTLVLGTALARTLVHALEHVRVGWTLGPEVELQLSIQVPQLERVIDYVSDYACPVEIPSVGETLEAVRLGSLPQAQAICWLLMRGAAWEVWYPVLDAKREKLTTEEVIEYTRRAGLPDDAAVSSLQQQGWVRQQDAEARVALYDELPTVGDFLHFLTRNIYNAEYVATYGLLEGFQERFWATYGPSLRAIGMTEYWASQHYAAHWIQPAPTQMQEFLYRLRPGAPDKTVQFTLADYRNVLTEQDYAPRAVEWFAQTAYAVPALGYIRDMYRQGVIDDAALVGYHQDLGYTEADSQRFLGVDRIAKDRFRVRAAAGWEPRSAAQAFAIGVLEENEVRTIFGNLGFTFDEATQAMERAVADLTRQVYQRARSRVIARVQAQVQSAQAAGVIRPQDAAVALEQLGFPQEQAEALASLNDAAARTALVKQATARIKHAVLAGEIAADYAAAALAQLGITNEASARFLLAWSVEQTPNRRRRTAAQITADVASGHMGTQEAVVRLTNLGYPDADVRLFLADAQAKVTTLKARELAAAQRDSRTRAAALQRIQKAAEAQRAAATKKLARLSPVGKLQKWAAQGIIGRNFFFSRLEAMGYDDADIQRYYDSACAAKNAQCATTPAEQTEKPPSGSSSG
jgi:hypothetical protein